MLPPSFRSNRTPSLPHCYLAVASPIDSAPARKARRLPIHPSLTPPSAPSTSPAATASLPTAQPEPIQFFSASLLSPSPDAQRKDSTPFSRRIPAPASPGISSSTATGATH